MAHARSDVALHPRLRKVVGLCHLGAITACLTQINEPICKNAIRSSWARLLPWCCVPLLRRIAVRVGCKGLEELRSVLSGMLVRLAEKLDPGEPVRFECDSPSFAACP